MTIQDLSSLNAALQHFGCQVDVANDVFGDLFRVWSAKSYLGSFYQNLTGDWISQPAEGDRILCKTDSEAVACILTKRMGYKPRPCRAAFFYL